MGVALANAAILAMNDQFAPALARHARTRSNGLGLCAEDSRSTPRTLTQSPPTTRALDDMNVVSICHVKTPFKRLTTKSLQNKIQSVNL
jgi:hypothetical protein